MWVNGSAISQCLRRASHYRWEGELCTDEEDTLLIKVSAERVSALTKRLAELHPYDLPEILALNIDAENSLAAYIEWVQRETA